MKKDIYQVIINDKVCYTTDSYYEAQHYLVYKSYGAKPNTVLEMAKNYEFLDEEKIIIPKED